MTLVKSTAELACTYPIVDLHLPHHAAEAEVGQAPAAGAQVERLRNHSKDSKVTVADYLHAHDKESHPHAQVTDNDKDIKQRAQVAHTNPPASAVQSIDLSDWLDVTVHNPVLVKTFYTKYTLYEVTVNVSPFTFCLFCRFDHT